MVRRIVEEDVATPTTTVVDNDGSWIGRTIVALVIITLLVVGAIWLVRAVSNSDTPNVNPNPGQSQQVDTGNTNPDTTQNSAPAPVQS